MSQAETKEGTARDTQTAKTRKLVLNAETVRRLDDKKASQAFPNLTATTCFDTCLTRC